MKNNKKKRNSDNISLWKRCEQSSMKNENPYKFIIQIQIFQVTLYVVLK